MTLLAFAAERGWSVAVDGEKFAAGDDAGVVASVLDALADGGFGAAVDALVAHGVAAMPAIVLVDLEGDALHVLVRGEAALVVETAAGPVRLSGSGVTTWSEQVLRDVSGWRVEAPGGTWTRRFGPTLLEGSASSGEAAYRNQGTPEAAGGSDTPTPSATQPAEESEVDDSTVYRPLPGLVEAEPDDVEPADETLVPDPESHTATPPSRSGPTGAGAIGEVPRLDPPTMPIPTSGIGPVPAAPHAADGDHDGQTIVSDGIRALLAERDQAAQQRPQHEDAASTTVGEPAPAALAQLELADGSRERIERPIIVGRAPSAAKVSGGAVPVLLKVGGEDPDISRTHARVALEGGTVVVTDLHSRNGTIVILPGKPPQRLRAGEPTAVLDGTVVDLGGGVTMTVRAG